MGTSIVRGGVAALIAMLHLSPALAGGALTNAEGMRLEAGETVVKTRRVAGFPWPEATVYRRVAASPEEVMAVYADFEGQAGLLPNLVESRVLRRLSRHSFHVYYEYENAGPNERYMVETALDRTPGGYRASWQLVSARFTRRLSGHLSAELFGPGALITHVNRVDPGLLGVTLGDHQTIVRQMTESVEALTRYVERIRVEQPDRLRLLARALTTMLSGPE